MIALLAMGLVPERPPEIRCEPVVVLDGDTIRCEGGVDVRIAGMNTRELRGNRCPSGWPCPGMTARDSQAVLVRLLGARVTGETRSGGFVVDAPTITYRKVDTNHGRDVGVLTLRDGRDARCAMVRAGAAAEWYRFVDQYGLEACGG